MPIESVTLDKLRRHVIATQGYASRTRKASVADVEAAISRLSCVQLDSISTVERSHLLTLASRVGTLPSGVTTRLLQEGRAFEHWAHEACLIPIEDYPLFKRRMKARREHHWFGPVIDSDPKLAREVLRAIRDKGPLRSVDFEGKSGGMWDWKPAKRMLEALWTAGDLAIAGRQGFQRLYDLPERVIPAAHLAARAPTESQWFRALALRAVKARGALTARGIVEHFRLETTQKGLAPHLDALVRAGELRRVAIAEGGAADVFVAPDANLDDPPTPRAPVLLSPFDNLLWDRPFAVRVLGFDHLIEVYKPAPQRKYGYYVMPFLAGDRIVGRVDLKSDRAEGVLRVKRLHWEDDVRRSERLEDAFATALERLAGSLGFTAEVEAESRAARRRVR